MAQPRLSAAVALGWPTQLPGKTNLRVKCQTARERCPNSPTPRQALGTFDQSLQGKRRAIGHVACEEVREEESAGSPGVRWAPGVGANGGACRRRARPRERTSLFARNLSTWFFAPSRRTVSAGDEDSPGEGISRRSCVLPSGCNVEALGCDCALCNVRDGEGGTASSW